MQGSKIAALFAPARIAARSLVIVGQRAGGSALYDALAETVHDFGVHLTGDALAPGAIAHAVYQAHRTAREVGKDKELPRRDAPFAMRDIARAAE